LVRIVIRVIRVVDSIQAAPGSEPVSSSQSGSTATGLSAVSEVKLGEEAVEAVIQS
jgi:hypothetical protein